MRKEKRNDGVSLRTIHLCLIVGAVIIAAVMLFSTYHLSTSFSHIADTAEQQITLRKAARELMDASDYLTESVQRFTVDGDVRFMDDYFLEAFENQHREDAIAQMAAGKNAGAALQHLQDAMNASLELMNREYYAMRLVVDAMAYTDYPEILHAVPITAEDESLAPAEKMALALRMVHDDAYYVEKNQIREAMRLSLDELEQMVHDDDAAMLAQFRDEMNGVRVIIMLQTIGILLMVWLTSRLGIHPVLNAVDRIKEDSPIPEVGANEFRYLARTYNKMYEVYKRSLERLNFKASHDELTGAYNRSGYELLLSSIDLQNTYMLLFDVDNFKSINDTYGHEAGDRVLVNLVQTLEENFRSDDYICRLGGDEFVVFMVHATEMQQHLLSVKIEAINRQLAHPVSGLPASSVSVGIVHGSAAASAEELFEKTDAAMYRAKQCGKSTYMFSV